MTGAAWACITRYMPARKNVRKRRSLRNPPSKRPSLAEQWDEYDAIVHRIYHEHGQELWWVDEGKGWAQRFVTNAVAMARLDRGKFDPEEYAADRWTDTASEAEARDSIGHMGAMIGFTDELERLTGRKFHRFNTADAADYLKTWNVPMAQIQKSVKKPRGPRP